MYSNILKLIGTRQEQLEIISKIDHIQQDVFKASFDFQQSLKTADNSNLASELLKLDLDIHNISGLRRQLQMLVEAISKMDVIEMRVAFHPSVTFAQKVIAWIKVEVADDCLVDFLYVSELLGGTTISYNGKYADYSFKSKLLREFNTGSDWIRKYFDL